MPFFFTAEETPITTASQLDTFCCLFTAEETPITTASQLATFLFLVFFTAEGTPNTTASHVCHFFVFVQLRRPQLPQRVSFLSPELLPSDHIILTSNCRVVILLKSSQRIYSDTDKSSLLSYHHVLTH